MKIRISNTENEKPIPFNGKEKHLHINGLSMINGIEENIKLGFHIQYNFIGHDNSSGDHGIAESIYSIYPAKIDLEGIVKRYNHKWSEVSGIKIEVNSKEAFEVEIDVELTA